jgi:alpha-galactosidase
MPETKVVLIGAGSSNFGFFSLCDAVNTPSLQGSTLTLVDIDAKKLRVMRKIADLMNKKTGARLKIEHTVDRKEALSGAKFVVMSIAVDRMNRWRLDWEIPVKHGIRQVIGENGGPGGLSHTLRNVPIIMEICRDIEDLCPDALLINYTNPLSRVCLAINRYSRVKAVGLCHELKHQLEQFSEILEVDRDELEAISAGLNHFAWILDLRFKNTGEDAYPLLREKLRSFDSSFQPLCRELFEKFGFYPNTDSNHAGEYVPYAWDKCPEELRGLNWINMNDYWGEWTLKYIDEIITGKVLLEEAFEISKVSGERAFRIIEAIVENRNQIELAVNIPNEGHISNIPQGAIVEIPALVNSSGVHGLHIGPLPKGIASLCNTQIAVQDLAVEAAITGDRNKALQALLIDPVVQDLDAAERSLDELLRVHAQYLPQFK